MNNKNIYEILNDTDLDLSVYDQEVLNTMEKKKIMKAVLKAPQHKFQGSKPAVAAAAFLVICMCAGTLFRSDVYAFVKALQYKLEMFILSEDLAPYVQVLNTTVSDQDIAVTLNEIVMDIDELVVTSTITMVNNENDISWMLPSIDLMIDGKLISNGASGAIRMADGNTFEFYTVYDISGYDINPEETHSVKYNVKKVMYYEQELDNEVSGKWEFKFSAEGGDLLLDTLSIPLDHRILLPDGNGITINKYTSNALGQKIYFDIIKPIGLDYLLELRGVDDKGRDVVFYISHMKQTNGVFKIEPIDNGYIEEDARTLTLIPYSVDNPKQSGKMNNNYTPIDMEITIPLK